MSTMRILLIRHGAREQPTGVPDSETSLSAKGRSEVEQRGRDLALVGIHLDAMLTSQYRHAGESGTILAGMTSLQSASLPVVQLAALTPHSETETVAEITVEAGQAGIDLAHLSTVGVVGHEPRLSQLLTRLTGSRARPLGRADAVCVEAATWQEFLMGQGHVAFRLPVVDYQESALRDKMHSKVSASALMAGFTSTGLFLMIDAVMSGFNIVAAILLAVALVLFVGAIFIYDRLSMPEGFWTDEERSMGGRGRGSSFDEACERNGPMHTYMVSTWRLVFTPAVFLALAGFLVMLLDKNDLRLLVGCSALMLVAGLICWRLRPQLGTD